MVDGGGGVGVIYRSPLPLLAVLPVGLEGRIERRGGGEGGGGMRKICPVGESVLQMSALLRPFGYTLAARLPA